MRESGDIDVHMVTHSYVGRGRALPRARGGGLNRRRQLAGYALAVALLPLLTLALASVRGSINLTSDVLVFLAGVIGVALVGGFIPALLAAVAGSLLLNYYFTPPHLQVHHRPGQQRPGADHLRRRRAGGQLGSGHRGPADQTGGQVRRGIRAAGDHGGQRAARTASPGGRARPGTRGIRHGLGDAAGASQAGKLVRQPASLATSLSPGPEDADVEMPVGDGLVLALRGRPLPATDRRVLGAFAAYAAAALEQGRLTAAAEAARPIAEADRVRTALLAAVSHDLRTPLASAKAAVTSLRSQDIEWDAEDHDELLATADESLDRLAHLVDNLLDMSRLPGRRAGGVPAACRSVRDRGQVAG